MWCSSNLTTLLSVKYVIILCGTNNPLKYSSQEVVDVVIATASVFKKKKKKNTKIQCP